MSAVREAPEKLAFQVFPTTGVETHPNSAGFKPVPFWNVHVASSSCKSKT